MPTHTIRFTLAIFAVGILVGYFAGRHETISTAIAEDAPAQAADDNLATVLTVQHGDEMEVLWKPNVPVRFSVRLSDADTPYRKAKFGEPAAQALADFVYGKKVHLSFAHPDKPDQDRSNRLLAYVKTAGPDGKFVNIEMIAAGWAEAMNHANPYADQFKAAEAKAKAEKLGRWSNLKDEPAQPDDEE